MRLEIKVIKAFQAQWVLKGFQVVLREEVFKVTKEFQVQSVLKAILVFQVQLALKGFQAVLREEAFKVIKEYRAQSVL